MLESTFSLCSELLYVGSAGIYSLIYSLILSRSLIILPTWPHSRDLEGWELLWISSSLVSTWAGLPVPDLTWWGPSRPQRCSSDILFLPRQQLVTASWKTSTMGRISAWAGMCVYVCVCVCVSVCVRVLRNDSHSHISFLKQEYYSLEQNSNVTLWKC